jgi:Flp pilus assembly protein TadD
MPIADLRLTVTRRPVAGDRRGVYNQDVMGEPVNAPESKRTPPYLPLILVALAAGLIALAVHFYGQKIEPPQKPPNPELTVADKVLTTAGPLMQAHQYAEARNLMLTYVAEFPEDTQVRPLLAQAQMALGQNEQAEHTVDQVIQRAPRRASVLWLKGELVRRRGQPNYMFFFRKAVEESVDATPETWSQFGRELLAAGQAQEADRWLGQAMENGVNDAATTAALGEVKLLAGQYEKARELLETACEKSPNNANIKLLLARACRHRGQLDRAANIVQSALDDHVDAELYMELAEIRLAQNRPMDAAGALVEAADFTAYRAPAALRAAKIFYQQHQYARAALQIEPACQLRPNDPEVLQLRAQILKAAGTQPTTSTQPSARQR